MKHPNIREAAAAAREKVKARKEQELRKAESFYSQGLSLAATAQRVHIKEDTLRMRFRRNGIVRRPRGRPKGPENDQRFESIRRMRLAGMTYAAIGSALVPPLTRQRVHGILRSAGRG
jgi:hypothetical protein